VELDMQVTKVCSICNVTKEITQFYKKRNNVTHRCIECEANYQKEYYRKNRLKRIAVAKSHSVKVAEQNRKIVVEHLRNNPCVDCGESDILVLQFDHFENKQFDVAAMVSNSGRPYSTKKVLNEISKCQVRCANCHQRKTAKTSNYWKLEYIVP
jgi:hypothetical protein